MLFLYDNIAALAVAALACGFAWIFGGTRGDMLMPTIPWLFVFLLEIMICFPQRHTGESTALARERVWKALRKDPLTWLVVIFIALLTIPFLNKGLCPVCDYAAIAIEGVDPAPPIPFLPYCVNRAHHLNVLLWFLPALTAMLAVKHALVHRGKRFLLEILVWNGAALAILGIVQTATGATGPLWATEQVMEGFFSTFGYPNMGGDYFTTLFGLSIALWRWNIVEEDNRTTTRVQRPYVKFWLRHLMLIPALLCFFAALATLSRAAILLSTSLAVIFVLHSYASFFKKMSRIKRVRILAGSIFAIVVLIIFAIVWTPRDFQKEVNTLNTYVILDRVTGRQQYHARVATEIWKENFLFGCGGWGYKHLCIPKMTEQELRQIQIIGGINVHNDYLQLLAEHGTVGFGLLVAMVVLLIMPIAKAWKVLMKATRFLSKKDAPPRPVAFFVLPAPVFCILLTALATLIHAFGDCPLRSPAVLTLFFVSLAAMPGFLPYSVTEE